MVTLTMMHLDGDHSNVRTLARNSARVAISIVLFCMLTAYSLFAAVAGIALPPPLGLVFLTPFLLLIFILAPELPGVPRSITWRLLLMGIALMPLWPVYLHIKLGPLPILTPTRLLFYAVIAIWVYEMACVKWRRLQFLASAQRLWLFFALIVGLFVLKIISVPMAEGSAIAAKETFRQIIIWLLPFFAVMTYVQSRKQVDLIITVILIGSGIVAAIALVEFATHRLMAEFFAPLMSDVEWLQGVLEEKSRDGTFRAQAVHTHPLSLGEHLAMAIPLAMYKSFRPGIGNKRPVFIGLLILLVVAALCANSRGAMIGGILALTGTGFLMARAFLKRPESLPLRPLAGMVVLCAILSSPAIFAAGYKLTVGEEGSKAARSSESRVEQIEFAWPKVLKRPVIGYGTGRSTRILGYYGSKLTIDNYYLNLALELGFPGPVFFLAAIFWMGWLGLRWGTKLSDDPYAGLYLAFAGSAVSFAITRSILSITTNIELLMVIFALIIGGSAAVKRQLKHPISQRQSSFEARAGYASPIGPETPSLDDHLQKIRDYGAPWHRATKMRPQTP